MTIGERLRALREQRNLSQEEIEKRTGVMRCYISRIEHGHIVPSIDTLEKMSGALGVPLYRFFYEADGPPPVPKYEIVQAPFWGRHGKEARLVGKFRRLFSRIDERDRHLLLSVARELADRRP